MTTITDSDSDYEYFDAASSFDDTETFYDIEDRAPLEDALFDFTAKNPHAKALFCRNPQELDQATLPEDPQFAVVIKTSSSSSVIWVDKVSNTLTYFNPLGRPAHKEGIDLKKLKDRFLSPGTPDENIAQVRRKDGSSAHFDGDQACLSFLAAQAKKGREYPTEKMPTLECTSVGSSYSPYGPASPSSSVAERATGVVNSRTVLSGASKPWDADRIRKGKLPALKAIGGEEVTLKTSSGEVHGCYFGVETFHQKIKGMGGEMVELRLSVDQPLLQHAKPVKVAFSDICIYSSVLIPYDSKYQAMYENLDSLQAFCAQQELVILDRNLRPIQREPQGWLSYFSKPTNPFLQDLIIVPERVLDRQGQPFKVIDSSSFDGVTKLLSPNTNKTKVIAFKEPKGKVEELFAKLQIDRTDYRCVSLHGKTYIVSADKEELFYAASLVDRDRLTIDQVSAEPGDLSGAGVVLLTMNQTSSYFQYPHEILTFLFEGASVMVYDNYEKGLSHGVNSERGIYEAVDASYRYLVDIQGFREDQVLAKGQCAGGPPTSELAASHPHINVWIDQAPQSYQGMIGTLYKDYAAKGYDMVMPVGRFPELKRAIVDSSFIPRVITQVLPKFDVATNLRKNKGAQLFTIGVADADGKGGDKLIPREHVEAIVQAVADSERGSYIPMPAAEHITDWWLPPVEKNGVVGFLRRTKIAPTPYLSGASGRSEDYISQILHELKLKISSDSKTTHDLLLDLITSSANGLAIDEIQVKINLLCIQLGEDQRKVFMKAALEVAKEHEQRELACYLAHHLSKS